MSAVLTVRLDTRPLERIEGDLAAVGIFSDLRPLRGAASRVDWRLCALVSRLLIEGRIRGAQGDALLVPTGGRMATGRVLVLGLGRRASYLERAEIRVRRAMRDLVERARGLGSRTLVMAPLGMESEALARHASLLLQGALDGLGESGARLRIQLAVAPGELRASERALEAAAASRPAISIATSQPGILRQPVAPRPTLRGSPSAPHSFPPSPHRY